MPIARRFSKVLLFGFMLALSLRCIGCESTTEAPSIDLAPTNTEASSTFQANEFSAEGGLGTNAAGGLGGQPLGSETANAAGVGNGLTVDPIGPETSLDPLAPNQSPGTTPFPEPTTFGGTGQTGTVPTGNVVGRPETMTLEEGARSSQDAQRKLMEQWRQQEKLGEQSYQTYAATQLPGPTVGEPSSVSPILENSPSQGTVPFRSPDEDVLGKSTTADTGRFQEKSGFVDDRSGWVAQSQDYWRDYRANLDERVESGELGPVGATARHTWATVADFLLQPFVNVESSAGKLGYDVASGADAKTITKDSAKLVGNGVLAGVTLYPGGSLLRGGQGAAAVANTGRAGAAAELAMQARFLEYQALRRQGYTASKARELIAAFDRGVNPGNQFAFHYTSMKNAKGIVDSGEIWITKNGLRRSGTYAGTIPNATNAQKTTQWFLTPGSAPVRIPVDKSLQSGVIQNVSFPRNTTIFRDGVKFTR